MPATACLDVGSTWTKGALVGDDGALLATAQHATTPPEVLDGVKAVLSELGGADRVFACSSAGGGLRLAVVGHERLISAEAGHRVALSAGAKVVHVSAGELDGAGIRALRDAEPDVVLLVGGTDGGDAKVLLHNASVLARNRIRPPIVLAGNEHARLEALEILNGRTVVPTANVLPDVGELEPGPARAAIRQVFLNHVIGGKGLSRGTKFRDLVKAVTPDAVLNGVSQLASEDAVLVVDVGGATTDVYSAVSTRDEEERAVGLPQDRRTVEGDIGMRWSAPGIVAEAEAERLSAEGLADAAARRATDVGFVPVTPEESEVDLKLAGLAAIIAIRRHLRLVEGKLGPRGAGLLVLSGGVFRHAKDISTVVAALRADPVLRPAIKTARIVVDRDYVLAPAGLLAENGQVEAARKLLTRLAEDR
ncbi:glutamate mutase L [Kibdelosporangium philippinense]|uniref:Glutamate mutase L n=1 Tax=Kibdelosporangium philippinense TaxID=211113 RepID=A0ABS8ZHE8_9PSEU|nr:glutamate mutase L [Kibdelosporangium philippinense]MCE7006071.1 glutamate mutase L [Kibdelosporangium philippinense]